MGRSFLSILLAGFLLAMATESRGYCWQPGMNPGFRGAPYVEQVIINLIFSTKMVGGLVELLIVKN